MSAPGREQVRRCSSRTRAAALVALVALLALTGCTGSQRRSPSPTPSTSAAAPGGSTGAADTSFPLGIQYDWVHADSYQGLLTDLRGGSLWYELEWCQVEPRQGQRSWTAADKNVARAKARGMNLFIKIRTGSCWATRPLQGRSARSPYTPSAPPADDKTYTDFVKAVAERYRPQGVTTYALENEVNASDFWVGTPEEYAKLVALGVSTLHGVDPGIRVADGGLSSTAYGVAMAQQLLDQGKPDQAVATYTQYYERRFARREEDFPRAGNVDELRTALATPQAKRNLAYVKIATDMARNRVEDVYQLHFYESWQNAAPLMRFLQTETGSTLPIEAWEVGIFWPQTTPDFQVLADETAKVLAGLFGGGARRAIFLPASYNPGGRGDGEVRWGLFNPGGGERPAANVIRVIAQAAQKGPVTWQAVDRPGLSGAVLTSASGTLGIVWSQTAQAPVALTAGTVAERSGGAQAAGTSQTLGAEPLLLRNSAQAGLNDLIAPS